jgi:hypothetical protein
MRGDRKKGETERKAIKEIMEGNKRDTLKVNHVNIDHSY